MNMPKVSKCHVHECAYNVKERCHALAVTIGNSMHPKCDTFFQSSTKGGDMNSVAGVGACKMSSCKFNQNMECSASEIDVGYCESEIDCLTFCTP